MNNLFSITKLLLIVLFTMPISVYAVEDDSIYGVISGKITSFRSDNKEYPMVGKMIQIYYHNDMHRTGAKTDDEGRFNLHIKHDFPLKKGENIKLKIDDDDYFILMPYNGEFNAPNNLINFQLPITVIANNSKMQVGQFNANFINDDIIKSKEDQAYSVQVLSSSSEKNALKEVAILKSNNYDAFTKPYSDFNGGTMHKVFILTFQSWHEANEYKKIVREIFKRRYKNAFVQTISVDKK